MKRLRKKVLISIVFLVSFVILPVFAFASSTDGTVDSTYKYVWSENTGWINFGTSNGNVHITDSGLSGYALSETAGWIYLGDVINDGEGNLSGYAWGENVGFIKFNPTNGGVIINSSGEFTGSALGENIGWIIFGTDYKVKTDWRSVSVRASTVTVVNSSGSASGRRNSASAISATTPSPTFSSETKSALISLVDKTTDLIKILAFWKSEPKLESLEEVLSPELAAKEPSNAMSGEWSFLPENEINKFIFAPLPSEIQNLVKKFPELEKTFKEVGITKISDLQKLKNAKFVLPGLNSKIGLAGGVRIPISSLTKSQKDLIPAEVVFAKAGNLIDYGVQLIINENNVPEQKITTIAGKPLDLAIKEDKPINEIKGYIVIKNIDRQQARKIVPADSLLATAFIASLGTEYKVGEEVKVEEKLVVGKFDYSDENNDGIYTASITAPLISGEYEIISIIDYTNPSLGKKELKLITVIDPEGYIYEENGNKETRIPDAKVSLYWKNPKSEKFGIWPAKDYQQINPQKTDKSGTYSFLVPEGVYKLSVSSGDYYVFESDEFDVQEGRGVHQNIKMKPKSWWRSLFNLFK